MANSERQDLIDKNYELYLKKLSELDIDPTLLVGKFGSKIKIATYNFSNKDCAGCGDGELLQVVLRKLTPTALGINKLLPEEKQIDPKSIIKVCLLSQLSKSVMVVPNTNKWEIENRGMLYKFDDFPYAMKMGMRSVSMCMQCGIHLNDNELEAISNLDREEDKQTKYFSSTLSTILRQAVELTDLINKK